MISSMIIGFQRDLYYRDSYGNAVRLAVSVGMGVNVGITVDVGGTTVLLGCGVSVNGSAVSVSGSVGYGEAVIPGRGVGYGVRIGLFGTQRISPM